MHIHHDNKKELQSKYSVHAAYYSRINFIHYGRLALFLKFPMLNCCYWIFESFNRSVV